MATSFFGLYILKSFLELPRISERYPPPFIKILSDFPDSIPDIKFFPGNNAARLRSLLPALSDRLIKGLKFRDAWALRGRCIPRPYTIKYDWAAHSPS